MYSAIVTRIKVRPHPNADRLQLGTCHGHQVIVGLDTQDNELGVFFPTDGQLSHDFCLANNLYTQSALQKLGLDDSAGKFGFFSEKRRVKSQKFRGEKSDGFWCPLSYLDYVVTNGGEILVEGDTLTAYRGVEICQKYYTPATLKAMAKNGKAGKPKIRREVLFPEHVDTAQFRYAFDNIPMGAVVYLTEKLHGTSGRYGNVLVKTERPWWQRWLFGQWKSEWQHLSGSRRVVLHNVRKAQPEGFYGTQDFRDNVVRGIELHKGEVLYFEIVGDVQPGKPIMPWQDIKDELKDLRKTYGSVMHYRYGCAAGEHKMFVYRITRLNEDGIETDLSWPQVKQRCAELSLQHVPEVVHDPRVMTEWERQGIREVVENFMEGSSTLDSTHIREGVVLRVESERGTQFLKAKSWAFGVLEGYIKDTEDYVDLEEAS